LVTTARINFCFVLAFLLQKFSFLYLCTLYSTTSNTTLMDLLSIFIIATGLSMDSFVVCIGKGMCRRRFNAWRAFRIAVVFGLFQGLMPLAGYALSIGFTEWIQQFDHWLAFIILLIIGIRMIYESYIPKKDEVDCTDCDCKETEG